MQSETNNGFSRGNVDHARICSKNHEQSPTGNTANSSQSNSGETSINVLYQHFVETTEDEPNSTRNVIAKTGTCTLIRSVSSTRRSSSRPIRKYKFHIIGLSLFIFLATCLLVLSISTLRQSCTKRKENSSNHEKFCMTEECVRTAANLLSAMDRTAEPCVDFFQYACGTWNRLHVIPEDRSSISTFEVLADELQIILKAILEEPKNEHDNFATIRAKMFYKSCMDIHRIREIGDAPLRKVLGELGGWPAVIGKSWQVPSYPVEVLLGRIRRIYNVGVFLMQWVGPDDKNSSTNILQLDQIQLALPSKDYYLNRSNELEMKAYHRYMSHVAALLGADLRTASEEFNNVIALERKLANVTLGEVDRHDASSIYRKTSLKELQKKVPQLKWQYYFQQFVDSPITEDEPIVVYALSYFVQMGLIIERTDRRTLHNYIIWRLVMSLMPYMLDEYQQKRIEYRKILLGVLSDRNRWSQCVEWTNKKLGLAVGALFIRDNFNDESKETALDMIGNIREAFNELLDENDWMDEETKLVAKGKADSINERIGYPSFLANPDKLSKTYETLRITETHFLENIFAHWKWEADRDLLKLRSPVYKSEWSTEPVEVNAFYNPNGNDIVFPAGILQPPFYSQHFPKSLNYGGIGVVIGHEITHGFDDNGRQFDKNGNMMQWWNNATIKAFRERVRCMVEQYSRYKIQEIELYVNGRMTEGENIADNGGLKQSFRAYKKWTSMNKEELLLPGLNLTHDQLFFLNYAQIWCSSMRPEDALTKVRSSVHSPGPVRVLGPLSNSEDFAKAYNCPSGSPMNPIHKCSVW